MGKGDAYGILFIFFLVVVIEGVLLIAQPRDYDKGNMAATDEDVKETYEATMTMLKGNFK